MSLFGGVNRPHVYLPNLIGGAKWTKAREWLNDCLRAENARIMYPLECLLC
ncbi:hypothetical protein LP7551_01880 [Roseibium album]|nr:hypothetical protein LP7551_01880 [Roseibium album]